MYNGIVVNQRYLSYNNEDIIRANNGMIPHPQILECHPSVLCNLSCDFCHTKWVNSYLGEKSLYANPIGEVLSINDYKRIIDEFISMGGRTVIISGGLEPTLYPSFMELTKILSFYKIQTHLYTNGITDIFINNVLELLANLSTIRISIHANAGFKSLNKLINKLTFVKQVASQDLYRKLFFAVYDDFLSIDDNDYLCEIIARLNIPVYIKDSLQSSSEKNAMEVYKKLSRYSMDNVIYSRQDSGKSSVCYSIYRNIVLDPIGGLHTCCMRGHLLEDDFAYIGNIKKQSLLDSLKSYNSINAQIHKCRVCSVRDYLFNEVVRESEECC